MIGDIIGGALKIGSSIFGNMAASKAMRKARKNIEQQQTANRNRYDRRYNEDATQRADAQRILTITQDNIRNRNRAAAGAQAVMGGTEESVASAKAANNEAMAEAASRIAANGERRKDAVEQQYLERDAQLQSQLNNLDVAKASSITAAAKGAGDAGVGIADAIEDSEEDNQQKQEGA